MLSNTATPFYYGQFRESVLKGHIPVCQEISMYMNIIDARIADPRYYYDSEAMVGYERFCENELCLTDGSPLFLLDTFKLWAEDLLCWYYYVEQTVPVPDKRGKIRFKKRRFRKRLINKQYLIIPRGAAKSMYDATFQGFYLVVYKKTTHQITTAPTMRQAEEVMSPLRTAITKARGPLFKLMTMGNIHSTSGGKIYKPMLASTKAGIQNFASNSIVEVRPMTVDKLQGLRLTLGTIDEWLSGDTREDVASSLEQGASKGFNPEWVLLFTSSEGTVRNGPGDEIKMELYKILRGEYVAPHTSIWFYKLDSLDEVQMPSRWLKANPNLGKTVTYETYQLDVERAEKNPAAKNDILAKRFNWPMEGHSYFFAFSETIPHRHHEFWGMSCSMGIDMSRGDDFCAFLFYFPLRSGGFGVKARCYITELTYTRLTNSMRNEYNKFLKEDSLVIMPGVVIDTMEVYEELEKYIAESNYDIKSVGFDPYNVKEFIERWAVENGERGIEKVIQGAKTESVPLGEIKKLAEQRLLIFDQEIMKFTMGNSIVIEDTNGNLKLSKMRYDQKIDCVSAMMDAHVAYKRNREDF